MRTRERDFKVWVTAEEQRKHITEMAVTRGLLVSEAAYSQPLPCGLIVSYASGTVDWCSSAEYAALNMPSGASPEEAVRRLRAFPQVRTEVPDDPVEHPGHYTDGGIEVIDYIEAKGLGYHLGNAVKYISRAGKKDPEKEVEDLEKAIWYIRRKIKLLKGKEKKA